MGDDLCVSGIRALLPRPCIWSRTNDHRAIDSLVSLLFFPNNALPLSARPLPSLFFHYPVPLVSSTPLFSGTLLAPSSAMPSHPVTLPAMFSTVPSSVDCCGGWGSSDWLSLWDLASRISCTAEDLVDSPVDEPRAEETAPWTYCCRCHGQWEMGEERARAVMKNCVQVRSVEKGVRVRALTCPPKRDGWDESEEEDSLEDAMVFEISCFCFLDPNVRIN